MNEKQNQNIETKETQVKRKRGRPRKDKKDNLFENLYFIGKVRKYGTNRLHIEVPLNYHKIFKANKDVVVKFFN